MDETKRAVEHVLKPPPADALTESLRGMRSCAQQAQACAAYLAAQGNHEDAARVYVDAVRAWGAFSETWARIVMIYRAGEPLPAASGK